MADLNLKFENGKAPALNVTNMNAIVDAINDKISKTTGVWTDDWVLTKNRIELGQREANSDSVLIEKTLPFTGIKVTKMLENADKLKETSVIPGDVWIDNSNPIDPNGTYSYSLLRTSEKANKNETDITTIKTDLSKLTTVDKNLEKRVTNLEYASQGILYRADVDDSEAITKNVDSGALPYASLDVIGAKSVVTDSGIKNANLKEIVSTGKNVFGGKALFDSFMETGVCTDKGNNIVSYSAQNISEKIIVKDIFKANTQYTFLIKSYNNKANYGYANLIFEYTDGTKDAIKCSINTDVKIYANVSASGKTVKSIKGSWYSDTVTVYCDESGIFEGAVSVNDYVPYTEITVDYRTLINKYFPQSMKSAGNVFDVIDLVNKKAIKKIGSVDLGNLNWTIPYATYPHMFRSTDLSNVLKTNNQSTPNNILTNKYITTDADHLVDGKIATNSQRYLFIFDSAYLDVNAFKSALKGQILLYEMADYEETDISEEDINEFKYLTVEGGGTLYFKTLDEFDVAIPTTETFAIKTGGAN